MKTIPPPCPEPKSGQQYWRSLDELAEKPEFQEWLHREFPSGASEFTDPTSRRNFVKLMSASFLLAGVGLTGCRRPEETILPFSKTPEGYIHGVPQFYATARPVRGSAVPLVARSSDGRPTKVEGNSLVPGGHGATDTFTQASILNMYDPDRAMRYTRGGNSITREAASDFLGTISQQAQANGGAGLHILSERSSSPSQLRLQKLIAQKFPQSKFYSYEAVDFDVHRRVASQIFGKSVKPNYKLDEASVIVSLDCDFVGAEEDTHLKIRQFAKGRRVEGPTSKMARLYSVESLMTLTGANADHRLRAPASLVRAITARLAIEVLRGSGGPQMAAALQKLAAPAQPYEKWIVACAKDLINPANAAKSIIIPGYRQGPEVHAMCHGLNVLLGNAGKTVEYLEVETSPEGSINELVTALNANQVQTLLMLDVNPAYNSPADLNWSQAQAKAKSVVRLGYYEDESFAGCTVHLPKAHYLESWGDARTAEGTVLAIQPLIAPLFNGITAIEVLARIAGTTATNPRDIVRETFSSLGGGDQEAWKKFLHDGFLAGSGYKPTQVQLNLGALGAALNANAIAAPSKNALEVVFHRGASTDDGRYANNGWLQEMPDPVTKMVWDNVILMSAKTAKEFGLEVVDHENMRLRVPVIRIKVGNRKVEGPMWIQPGMADYSVGIALGYGRKATGRVGRGVGFDGYPIRTGGANIVTGAQLETTATDYQLSTTQNHGAMEGRPIIREATLEQFKKTPGFAKGMNMEEAEGPTDAKGHPQPMYPNPLDVPDGNGKIPRDKSPHAWGMSIDLGSCVGCSACMMACQSENNVPIVGKDLVNRNREMHWIRIDRYYTGSAEDPQMVTQPMLCQHCEAAPCENVCPVNATAHDEEGLNVMVYNRCVGTRYCSNNCPYKVRRFNYLDYNRRSLEQLKGPIYSSPLVHRTDGEWDMTRWWKNPDRGIRPDDEWEILKLVKNPDVTVRMRGVMEKCTFCIQRIEGAKIVQKVKAGASGNIEVPDGTIKTACQQACPADAIVFGNTKDPNSQVSKLKKQERDYTVLDFLATKPRLTYLARIRNPNPEMPEPDPSHSHYNDKPGSFQEWEAKGNSLEAHGEHGAHGAQGGHEQGAGAATHPAEAAHEKKGAH